MLSRCFIAAIAAIILTAPTYAQEQTFTRTEDVIYGRKFGVALTMDVFTPKEKANGRGVIFCMSGGWFSAKEHIDMDFYKGFIKAYVDRGYVVFAVVHGSQPKFTVPEILEDMNRAVRFIKYNAKKYNVDPDKLGISGLSAGGHLSLMQGSAFQAGDPKAADPVNRESSRVAAVACFVPPTDFLNYGKEGELQMGTGVLSELKAPFDFHEFDPKNKMFIEITDQAKRKEITKTISPIYHVSKESAPTLIFHGEVDNLVPIQQAELIIAKYKEVGVPCELVVKKGAGHVWPGMDKDIKTLADWFDKYLTK